MKRGVTILFISALGWATLASQAFAESAIGDARVPKPQDSQATQAQWDDFGRSLFELGFGWCDVDCNPADDKHSAYELHIGEICTKDINNAACITVIVTHESSPRLLMKQPPSLRALTVYQIKSNSLEDFIDKTRNLECVGGMIHELQNRFGPSQNWVPIYPTYTSIPNCPSLDEVQNP